MKRNTEQTALTPLAAMGSGVPVGVPCSGSEAEQPFWQSASTALPQRGEPQPKSDHKGHGGFTKGTEESCLRIWEVAANDANSANLRESEDQVKRRKHPEFFAAGPNLIVSSTKEDQQAKKVYPQIFGG